MPGHCRFSHVDRGDEMTGNFSTQQGFAWKSLWFPRQLRSRRFRSGQISSPLSVINPIAKRRRQRSLFSSVHLPCLVLGLKRWIVFPSYFLIVESIHPKHNASSTASRYQRASTYGVLPRLATTQHSLSVLWFSTNQSWNSARHVTASRFLGVISSLYGLCFWWSLILPRYSCPDPFRCSLLLVVWLFQYSP